MTQPPGGVPGHPEPEPLPSPEPDPPMPIPPPEPVPHPEPPHTDAGHDFIDAAPTAEVAWPPIGSFPDERPATSRAQQLVASAAFAEETTVWHQPPPSGPFHARHEKPGEWRYDPPEHLAHQHSPPAEVQIPAGTTPPRQLPPADAGDRRRRSGLWLSVALTTTLLLCGGGAFSAYVLLRNAEGGGAPDPATAVNEFLTAVYTQQDAASAEEMVCRESRDREKLAARITQIKGYATEYDAPTFRWNEPSVATQTEDRATVAVQLTMSTEDEKTAQQQLTVTTVRKTGWLVCEIAG